MLIPKYKFNELEVGEIFQTWGLMRERCRRANKYWKRYGRRFIYDAERNHIKRIK